MIDSKNVVESTTMVSTPPRYSPRGRPKRFPPSDLSSNDNHSSSFKNLLYYFVKYMANDTNSHITTNTETANSSCPPVALTTLTHVSSSSAPNAVSTPPHMGVGGESFSLSRSSSSNSLSSLSISSSLLHQEADPCKEDDMSSLIKVTDEFREIRRNILKSKYQSDKLDQEKGQLITEMNQVDDDLRKLSQLKEDLSSQLKRIDRKQSTLQEVITNSEKIFQQMKEQSKSLEQQIQQIKYGQDHDVKSMDTSFITVKIPPYMYNSFTHGRFSCNSSVLTLSLCDSTQRLLSGSTDGIIRIWDINRLTQVSEENAANFPATNSPRFLNYQDLDQYSEDDCITFENSGSSCSQLTGHNGWIKTLEWLNDPMQNGRFFLSGGGDCEVRLWDTYTSKCRHTFVGHEAGITCVTSNHSQSSIISGSLDRTIRWWDKITGRCICKFLGHDKFVKSVRIVDDQIMISSGADNMIRLWDLKSGKCFQNLKHEGGVNKLCSDDNYDLISGGRNGTIHCFDLRTFTVKHSVNVEHCVLGLELQQQSKTQSQQQRLKKSTGLTDQFDDMLENFVQSSNGETSYNEKKYENNHGEKQFIFCTDKQTCAFLYNKTQNQLVKELRGHEDVVSSICCSEDWIVSASKNGTIKFYRNEQ